MSIQEVNTPSSTSGSTAGSPPPSHPPETPVTPSNDVMGPLSAAVDGDQTVSLYILVLFLCFLCLFESHITTYIDCHQYS